MGCIMAIAPYCCLIGYCTSLIFGDFLTSWLVLPASLPVSCGYG